jgi:hypothetical protein
MLRPSPNTSTTIRGIRKAPENEYQHFPGFCLGCILPINTGRELPGESLVIDFESKYFCGTVLFRIKNIPEVSSSPACGGASTSYFHGKKRRFHAVVKGKFKTSLRMSECVTGQLFDRPPGKLPAKWIVTSFIKFVSVLAPQLEATIDAKEPRFLSPLVATAHTVLEKDDDAPPSCETEPSILTEESDDCLYNNHVYTGATDMEDNVEEPSAEESTSIMKYVRGVSKHAGVPIAKRQKIRKKAYNHIFASKAKEPRFQLDKEYTFEFYQHLLRFDDSLAIDMGHTIGGQVDLAPITDGQPIKFMSAHKDTHTGKLDMLWSFDIWHESLYSYAQAAEED